MAVLVVAKAYKWQINDTNNLFSIIIHRYKFPRIFFSLLRAYFVSLFTYLLSISLVR